MAQAHRYGRTADGIPGSPVSGADTAACPCAVSFLTSPPGRPYGVPNRLEKKPTNYKYLRFPDRRPCNCGTGSRRSEPRNMVQDDHQIGRVLSTRGDNDALLTDCLDFNDPTATPIDSIGPTRTLPRCCHQPRQPVARRPARYLAAAPYARGPETTRLARLKRLVDEKDCDASRRVQPASIRYRADVVLAPSQKETGSSGAPASTSYGRLLDAVSCIVGARVDFALVADLDESGTGSSKALAFSAAS